MVRMPIIPEGWLDGGSADFENYADSRVKTDTDNAKDLAGLAATPSLSAAGMVPGPKSLQAADYAESHANSRSLGRCYRYVKHALQNGGAISDHMPGEAARDAGPELARRGYVNILQDPQAGIRSPYDAPAGSVLVYDSMAEALANKSDHGARYGHIEIRTPGGFASDYSRPHARIKNPADGLSGNGRRLIGVYVNPQ